MNKQEEEKEKAKLFAAVPLAMIGFYLAHNPFDEEDLGESLTWHCPMSNLMSALIHAGHYHPDSEEDQNTSPQLCAREEKRNECMLVHFEIPHYAHLENSDQYLEKVMTLGLRQMNKNIQVGGVLRCMPKGILYGRTHIDWAKFWDLHSNKRLHFLNACEQADKSYWLQNAEEFVQCVAYL